MTQQVVAKAQQGIAPAAATLVSLSGAKIFGINSARMVEVAKNKQLESPMWVRKSELVALGMESITPGVPCNNSLYFHTTQLRDPHELPSFLMTKPYIPFNHRGTALFKEDMHLAKDVAEAQGLTNPYWIPKKVLKNLEIPINGTTAMDTSRRSTSTPATAPIRTSSTRRLALSTTPSCSPPLTVVVASPPRTSSA